MDSNFDTHKWFKKQYLEEEKSEKVNQKRHIIKRNR